MSRLTKAAIVTMFVLSIGQEVSAQGPTPLFPRHRRGIYVNRDNIEVIDATPQSPPLEIDDPGVPGRGDYELNFSTGADLTKHLRHVDVLAADANYGIVLKGFGHELPTQVKLEVPVVASRQIDSAYAVGVGNAAFGLKFNFYNDDNRGLRISTYPQIEGSMHDSVDKGVADAGETILLPLLISHESKYLTMAVNAGLSRTFHDPDKTSAVDLAFGAGRPFFRKLAVMADVTSESATNFKSERLIAADAGFIYGVRKAIWYGRVGHSIFSDDGSHLFLGFGVKVMLGTS